LLTLSDLSFRVSFIGFVSYTGYQVIIAVIIIIVVVVVVAGSYWRFFFDDILEDFSINSWKQSNTLFVKV
jgi:hypothetical protein